MKKQELISELSRYLSKRRIAHSYNVAEAAVGLSKVHAPKLKRKALIAGLLHDNAKKLSARRLISYARKFDIEVGEFEIHEPSLLHGKVGAALLPKRFGVKNAEIRQAIADHVTGRASMGLLSRILFVADQAAADRDFPGVNQLRKAAYEDLDLAVWLVARFKLAYILGRGKRVVTDTIEVYNSFMPDEVPESRFGRIKSSEIKGKRRSGGQR